MTLPVDVPSPPLNEDGIPDFTVRRDPIEFAIRGERFAAPPVISAITLARLSRKHVELLATSDIDKQMELVADTFKILVGGEAGERFRVRLLAETDDIEPIDLIGEALPALYWLLERYGLRPMVPSPASPAGLTETQTASPNGAHSSTDGASPTESGDITS